MSQQPQRPYGPIGVDPSARQRLPIAGLDYVRLLDGRVIPVRLVGLAPSAPAPTPNTLGIGPQPSDPADALPFAFATPARDVPPLSDVLGAVRRACANNFGPQSVTPMGLRLQVLLRRAGKRNR